MNQLLRHFGFDHHPFGRQTPSAALLHHPSFDEALARLRYSVELDAVAMLVAEPGCGKSLALGQLADELQQQSWTVHYLAHSTIGPFGLINVLSRKVGLAPRRSRGETALQVVDRLMHAAERHLLVLDDAHALPDASLEDIRLLTIADFDRKSPFLLLLAGQPDLDDRLAEPTHRALDQRITTVARLQPLSLDQTRQYIELRMKAAGASTASKSKRSPIFEPQAVDAVFEASAGIPRRINGVATSALIIAAARDRATISAQDVLDARLERGRA